MGQECATCIRGIPAGAKNMQDVDLSKNIVEPIKEVFRKVTKTQNQSMKEPDEPKESVITIEPPEFPVNPSTRSKKELESPPPPSSPLKKYKKFSGPISKKLTQKVLEVDSTLEFKEEDLESLDAYILDDGTIYQGLWDEKDEKTGEALEVRPDGSKFVGYFRNNLREGKGRLIYANGDYYEGNFRRGKIEGKGKYVSYESAVYDGQFKAELKHGFGKEMWPDGSVYEGFFEDGSICGIV